MNDPLDVLRGDDLPVAPDPAFAARLRARLESALSLPNRTEGVTMSGTDTAIAELNAVAPVAPRPAALPYLAVAGARDAVDWYVDAFGAVPMGDPIVMDDGRIGHAELSIDGGVLYLADEFPELGLTAPAPQAVSVSLMLHVADTDAALARARDRGARVERDVYEGHGSRNATIVDPFGHRWMLSGPVAGAVSPIRHGDIGYVSVWTQDPERSAAFYGRVLGWRYDAASRRVINTDRPVGIVEMPGPPTLFCCYAVADVAVARQAILAAGGEAGEVVHTPHGPTVDATDPSGTAFAVYQPTGDDPRPALNGTGPGELSYVTFQVSDSASFRRFYGRVLGWSYEPGRIEDGWEPRSVHPMAGIAGGSAEPATVPMWTVDDVDAAVQRVRDAGGTVIEESSAQSYGSSALCADDQGVRFYLGAISA
ncbi:glyoxalase [Mycolicibacterium sp. P1-18]|uniref:VOC family protein n=1 Tax=Mycolicibacterium sp. P1-18 TaxID=2024615 RepID=UPI0011F09D6B|nr:VOC family protein [Mycolicibacterium sp. P1-18]KAA0098700.1 glyoxalase [Mycolicibacterium sp. P1-18]